MASYHPVVWYIGIYLGIVLNYQFISRYSPFQLEKTYDSNENAYLFKEVVGKIVSFILFVALLMTTFNCLPDINGFINMIIGVVSFVLAFIPIGRLSSDWDNYIFKSFQETIEGKIVHCEPTKCEIQGNHYKKVGMDTTCKVTVDYQYANKMYKREFGYQPIKIFYTFEENDKVALTVSTKNASLVLVSHYLFDRPIDKERYDISNYGEYDDSQDGDSGCGGCD